MRSQRVILLLAGVLIFALSLGLKACSPADLASSNSAVQTVVQEQLQGTLQSILVQTDTANRVSATVAEMAMSMATATPQPTSPPPTATPMPTATPIPVDPPVVQQATAVPPTTGQTIQAEVNTNCRIGPSTYYLVIGYLMKGATSTVLGRDATRGWWYIQNPTDQTENCWVWAGSTQVQGDTSGIAVVTVQPGAGQAYSQSYNYGYYSGCYNYYTSYYGCGYKNYSGCGYKNYCGCGNKNFCGNVGNCKVKRLVCQKPNRCDWVTYNRCGCDDSDDNGCFKVNVCYNPCSNVCNGYPWYNGGGYDPIINYH